MCAPGCERVCPSLEGPLTPELAFTGTVPAVALALAVSAAFKLVVSATSSMYYARPSE